MKKRFLPLFFITAMSLTACGGKSYSSSEYIAGSLEYESGFKILQLTDIHLSDKDDQALQLKFVDHLIEDAKANNGDKLKLMVVTGDLFTFASRSTAKKLFKHLDQHGIKWTVVFGNHDEQTYFPVDWMTGYLNNYGSNCVFKDIQDDNVQGNCNFAINLTSGTTIKKQLIFMDSNRYYFGSYFGYDYFKEDQMKWYEDLVDDTTKQNGGAVVDSLMFYHIPLFEVNDAYDKGTRVYDGPKGNGDGKREDCCPPDVNSGFFDRIVAKGSTKAMFFGHDHINSFESDYTYKGQTVKFCYGIKSTDRIYYDDDLLGYQTITLTDDAVTVNRSFHTYAEVE